MKNLEKQGSAFREFRKRNNFTIEEVTNKLNKSKVWLSEIENGKKNIYFENAKKLCKLYGITLDDVSNLIDEL